MTAEELSEFKSSRINAFHCAVGFTGEHARETVKWWFSRIDHFLVRHHRVFAPVYEFRDLEEALESGRNGLISGVQNSEHFRSVDDVEIFYGLGQRISQLTYNQQNAVGSGCNCEEDAGLTDFGRQIVEKMNRVGMVVDLSHAGERTALDAIEVSSKPIWISHSNCSAVHKHPRCVTDEVIRAVANAGGIFGVTFWSVFVSDSDPASIEEVLRHVDHVAELVGPEFLAIGSDLDMHGYDSAEQYARRRESLRGTPAYRRQWDIPGLDNPHRMLNFAAALWSRGYSEPEVAGIMGENARRVLRENWTSSGR